MSPLVWPLFAVFAFLYGSVGLGGGSAYAALLSILKIPYQYIAPTALTLNLVVTFIGALQFAKAGHFRVRRFWPLLLASAPMAFLGGVLPISRQLFQFLLLFTLILVAVRIYLWPARAELLTIPTKAQPWILALLGAMLGFIAGVVGIGGGIYMVPLLIALGLASEKQAAAVGPFFVWLNSLAGLAGHLQRMAFPWHFILPLTGVVLIGGWAGSWAGAFRFSRQTMQRALGVVILLAIALLTRKML